MFWSGTGNVDRAMSMGRSLESTPIGGFANNYLGFMGRGKVSRYMWNRLSSRYSHNAKGQATKIGNFEGPTWLNIEKPILRRNGVEYNVIP